MTFSKSHYLMQGQSIVNKSNTTATQWHISLPFNYLSSGNSQVTRENNQPRIQLNQTLMTDTSIRCKCSTPHGTQAILQKQLIFFSDYHGDDPKLGWFNILMIVVLSFEFSWISKSTCSFLMASKSKLIQNLNFDVVWRILFYFLFLFRCEPVILFETMLSDIKLDKYTVCPFISLWRLSFPVPRNYVCDSNILLSPVCKRVILFILYKELSLNLTVLFLRGENTSNKALHQKRRVRFFCPFPHKRRWYYSCSWICHKIMCLYCVNRYA